MSSLQRTIARSLCRKNYTAAYWEMIAEAGRKICKSNEAKKIKRCKSKWLAATRGWND